jgi:hypothetical protein
MKTTNNSYSATEKTTVILTTIGRKDPCDLSIKTERTSL